MRHGKFFLLGLLLILLLFTGCAQRTNNSDQGSLNPEEIVVKELSVRNPDGLPDYAFNSIKTKAGYVAALEIPDTFSKVPCYCSCGAVGHKSLRDCFLETEGGFEEHASYCDICVNEALDVYTWQKQGVPLSEIRQRIDEKYQRYGEPTSTEEADI